ncbi:GntR family transcriptional regulator [soil metagenome]
MIFALNPSAGVPVYLQIMQQIRHAIDTGVLQRGDLLPGIRPLAQDLVVSHNTVAKAYSELQHEGLIELRHGSGAYISARRRSAPPAEAVRRAQQRVRGVVAALLEDGFAEEPIRRLFEAELLNALPTRVPTPR